MRSLADRFSYHTTDTIQREQMETVRLTSLTLATMISTVVPVPEADQAIDLLERAMMIANAGISRGPITMVGQAIEPRLPTITLYEQRVEHANGENFIHVCRAKQREAHPEGEIIPEDRTIVCHEDPIGFIATEPSARLLSRTEHAGYIEVHVV